MLTNRDRGRPIEYARSSLTARSTIVHGRRNAKGDTDPSHARRRLGRGRWCRSYDGTNIGGWWVRCNGRSSVAHGNLLILTWKETSSGGPAPFCDAQRSGINCMRKSVRIERTDRDVVPVRIAERELRRSGVAPLRAEPRGRVPRNVSTDLEVRIGRRKKLWPLRVNRSPTSLFFQRVASRDWTAT